MNLKFFDAQWEEYPYKPQVIKQVFKDIETYHRNKHKLPTYITISEPNTEQTYKVIESQCFMNFEHCYAIYRMVTDDCVFTMIPTNSDCI